jgi:hypothetical protein
MFQLSGTIFVTGAGPNPVVTPAGTCAAMVQCIFFADEAGTANFGDISTFGLPSGVPPNNIPLSIAGPGNATMAPLLQPPSIPPNISPAVAFMGFVNPVGLTTVLMLNTFPLGINGTSGCPPGPPPAAGQVCTPPGSVFNLQNLTATSSIVSFSMSGVSADKTANWTGTFSSQFAAVPYQTVLANLASNGFVFNTYSAQITLSPVPEPGSLSFLLLGSGMIASATLLRRLSRR